MIVSLSKANINTIEASLQCYMDRLEDMEMDIKDYPPMTLKDVYEEMKRVRLVINKI